MQYEVPMPLDMNHNMPSGPHYASQNLYVPNGGARIKTESGSDGRVSPHTSEQPSRYATSTPQNLAYQQIANSLSNGMNSQMRYPSPSQLQAGNMPLIQHSYHPNAPSDSPYSQAQLGAVQQPVQQDQNSIDGSTTVRSANPLPKAFACSTCSKGFARRSDLARHERIHSGIRPHVCDHPGCGKQFIQRSALTVHSRVHTGEKPHMCERCGKPFSDSSSLARHRRIHSGKRPYKCPYADCQKTFTRRTTLTRHQNHHTGTIEESEAATAAALASRVSMGQRSRGSDEEEGYSVDGKSPLPNHPSRPSSVSPGSAMAGVPSLSRSTSDYYMNAMTNGMAVPAHLRGEMQGTPRSASPAQYQLPVNGQVQQRPPLTSNPSSGYNPPQILEPPAANGQSNGSAHNSPHMGNTMGWQSPHSAMTSNGQQDYAYTDANGSYAVNPAAQMYYQQRPHSTGPMDYPNINAGQAMWSHHQS